MIVSAGELVRRAAAAGSGLGAFNAITLEHAEAIVAGAQLAERPVVLAISENAVKFHNGQLAAIAAACRRVADQSPVEVGLHLDHVQQWSLLEQAPTHGFSSAMFDASTLDYPNNVELTARAAKFCHDNGVWLEGELGEVGGKDAGARPGRGAHEPGVRTDPDQAREYAQATGVDALAVAVGTSHAMLSRTAVLDLDLIAALRAGVGVPLVLHGSSGVSDAGLRAAVAAGMVKINVGTALNKAFTAAVRQGLAGDADLVDPRKYLATAREAMAKVVAQTLTVLWP